MEVLEFKKLLLKTAIYTIAVDGQVLVEEKNELINMKNSTNYFTDLDFDNDYLDITGSLLIEKDNAYNKFFDNILKQDLSVVEILLLFEVIIRIVKSNKTTNESDIAFIKRIRRLFRFIEDKIFIARFGNIEYLLIDKYENNSIDNDKLNVDFSNIVEKDFEIKNSKSK